ncbi:glycosyltransferase family 9 protein [Rhodopila sp.]|uniref:glycosyltransferase family 9 protein n=1 Tax=Rhodopila sp. TaxID=2480087 RepID=UPI003D0B9EB8
MKILFVTSTRLGDAVLSTGLLDHLIRRHPAARITVVCGPVAEGVFARMPNRERTIVLRKQSGGRHWVALWRDVAMHVWDLVVDIRGSALSWLVPTRRRAVFRRVAGPKIAQLGAILGVSPPPSPVVWTDTADQREASGLLPADRPIVALAPTANWDPKVWPAERFAAAFGAVAGSLVANPAAVVLGGPGARESAMAAPLLAALPGAIDLVGGISLAVAAAVLQRSSLFIGNDSGLMHLAAAAGAPTIGLFGPTDAATYAPVGRCAVAVVGGSMDEIPLARVVEAAARLLR